MLLALLEKKHLGYISIGFVKVYATYKSRFGVYTKKSWGESGFMNHLLSAIRCRESNDLIDVS